MLYLIINQTLDVKITNLQKDRIQKGVADQINSQNRKNSRNIPIINERIKFPKIRLINSDGEQMGVFDNTEAKKLAKEQQLDLVVISDKSDPPVCRIIDYGKYKFAQEKKAKEARKKQQKMQ